MSYRIVFAGTPEFAAQSLKALLQSSHTVLSVYTQPDKPSGRGQQLTISPVKQLALQHQIPVQQPTSLKTTAVHQALSELKPDLILVAAYGFLLPKSILEIPTLGCLNVHASLLPRWRGASPIQHAIMAQDKTSGISIMQMDLGMDTGDILSAQSCPIYPEDTSQDLHDRLAELGANTLLECLEQLEQGILRPKQQDPTQVTVAPKLSKQDAHIRWDKPAQHIEATIRAFIPWPIAYTEVQGQTLRIWKATLGTSNGKPGTILSATKAGIEVATQEGSIRIVECQLPGGKRLPAEEMLRSKQDWFKPGTQLV